MPLRRTFDHTLPDWRAFLAPPAARPLRISDDFGRADGPLESDPRWVRRQGQFNVVGGAVNASAVNTVYTADLPVLADQFAEFVYETASFAGAALRVGDDLHRYEVHPVNNGGVGFRFERVTPTGTRLNLGGTATPAVPGRRYRFTASGTALTLLDAATGATLLTLADATLTAGRVGLHARFVVARLREFAGGALDGGGATISRLDDAGPTDATADRTPGGALEVILSPGTAGVALRHAWDTPAAVVHARLDLAPHTLDGGAVTVLRLHNAADTAVASLVLDPVTRRLTWLVDGAVIAAGELFPQWPWHTVEVSVDRTAATAALWIDGLLIGTSAINPAGAAVTAAELGAPARSAPANGAMRLGPLAFADGPLGARLRAPTRPDASDPRRWLVLYGRDDADARSFVYAYHQRRGVPRSHLVGLASSAAETIDAAAFAGLREQVAGYVASQGMAGEVVGVIVGPGVPGWVLAPGRDDPVPTAALLEAPAGWPVGLIAPSALHGASGAARPVDRWGGRWVASRLDAPTPAEALAMLDRADAATAPLVGTDALLLDSTTGLPVEVDPLSASWSAWAQGPEAGALRLTIRTTHDNPSTADFSDIAGDAFVISLLDGAVPSNLFVSDPHARRVFAFLSRVAGPFAQPALRTPWAGGDPLSLALAGGYAAAASASALVSASEFPEPAAFFAALREGTTLGEAWLRSRPFVGGAVGLVGDPLVRLTFPSSGVVLRGPADGWSALQRDDGSPRRGPSGLTTASLVGPGWYAVAGEAEHVLGAPGAVARVGTDGRALPIGAAALLWPIRAGHALRVDDAGCTLLALWSRPLDRAQLAEVWAEDDRGGAPVTVTWRTGDRWVSVRVPRPVIATRWRLAWRHVDEGPAASAWSAVVGGLTLIAADRPLPEVRV